MTIWGKNVYSISLFMESVPLAWSTILLSFSWSYPELYYEAFRNVFLEEHIRLDYVQVGVRWQLAG